MAAVSTPLRERLDGRAVPAALAALTALSLALHCYDLGNRVFYYDEAWFGYWILKFVDHGVWEYRAVLHGPFYARVNSAVFMLFGASDVTGRLVVALIGGVLPLSAWLFRDHLRDVELVALGTVLALNPILLYYGRFMRKDLPLAAFMLVTLGLLLRFHAARRPGYLYAAGATLGLAFTTKESVLLWLVTWAGAATLVLDRHLLRARDTARGGDAVALLRSLRRDAGAGARRWGPHLLGAGLVWFVVVVYFYAPRAHGVPGPGIWKALGGQFGMLPAVVNEATVGTFEKMVTHWVEGSKQNHPYLPYLRDTLRTLAAGAPGVVLLAVVGFLYDRYAGAEPRGIVAFNFYAGVAATLGYPLANHFPVPWSTVHAVVPFAVPAAVGAGVVARYGTGALPAHDRRLLPNWNAPWAAVRAGLATGLLAFLLVTAATTAVQTSFVAPHESPAGDPGNEIIYYAQPPGDLQRGIAAIRDAAASGGDDLDLLYVGAPLAGNESAIDRPPETGAWYARQPLPWYAESAGADVQSVEIADAIGDAPPVVVTSPDGRDAVADALGSEYESWRQPLDDVGDRTVVFFVRR
jgi:uncharacterized protein (TIGR03663 family)